MKHIIFAMLVLACICSCKSNNKSEATVNSFNATNIVEPTEATTLTSSNSDSDSCVIIPFTDFSVRINHFVQFTDDEAQIDTHLGDTVFIHAEIGETIEDQRISISSEHFTDFAVEQCYETSVTIMNEGPHCDLTEWKHFYSAWKPLKEEREGYFLCDSYTSEESQRFPRINIEDLKTAVKIHCNEHWYDLVKHIKSPTQYPSAVGISRYFLKVSGKSKVNQQYTQKIIVIDVPMGC